MGDGRSYIPQHAPIWIRRIRNHVTVRLRLDQVWLLGMEEVCLAFRRGSLVPMHDDTEVRTISVLLPNFHENCSRISITSRVAAVRSCVKNCGGK